MYGGGNWMRRVTVVLSILLVFLSACSTNSNLLPNKAIEEIVITKVEDGSTYRLTDKKSIEIFKHAFTEVEKIDGVISIQKQEYEVTFHFNNDDNKPLFMWLSDETGMAMDPEDSSTGYGLKDENVEAIHAIDWK